MMQCDLMCIAIRKNILGNLNIKRKMQIVNIIFIYITVGVLFCLAIDYAYVQKDRGHFAYQHMPEKGITNLERVLTIALWPLALLMAIKQIIKDFKNRL